jgi:hypothetical protein
MRDAHFGIGALGLAFFAGLRAAAAACTRVWCDVIHGCHRGCIPCVSVTPTELKLHVANERACECVWECVWECVRQQHCECDTVSAVADLSDCAERATNDMQRDAGRARPSHPDPSHTRRPQPCNQYFNTEGISQHACLAGQQEGDQRMARAKV